MHVVRLGKTDCAGHKPLHPGPQIAVFALDFLRIVLAHLMLCGVDVPLVGCVVKKLMRPFGGSI
jgi:hypothetical protein